MCNPTNVDLDAPVRATVFEWWFILWLEFEFVDSRYKGPLGGTYPHI